MGAAVGEAITRAAELALEKRLPLLVISRLRRRPHAGGLRLADADGQDEPGASARLNEEGAALRLAAHRPDLRRRQRLLRHPRRRADRRAGRAHRLRRPVGDRADDRRDAARRLPDRRVPAGARDARPRRAAREPAAARSATWSSSTRGPRTRAAPTPTRSCRSCPRPRARTRSRRPRSLDERDPWEVVQLARELERPHTLDYVGLVFDDFVELHGDRSFGEDPAIVGGLGAARRPGGDGSSATRRAAPPAR